MAEQMAVAYIAGDAPIPVELGRTYVVLVEKYRAYAKERGESVSYPRAKDAEMDAIYDLLVETAQ